MHALEAAVFVLSLAIVCVKCGLARVNRQLDRRDSGRGGDQLLSAGTTSGCSVLAEFERNVAQAAALCPVSNAIHGNVEISVRSEFEQASRLAE
jgi:hypothetical protein